jgi:hypothetical protein
VQLFDIILVSAIAYLVANTAFNFAGRADPRSMQYVVPLVAGVLVACLCLFVRFRRRSQSAVSIAASVLAVLGAVLALCLVFGAIAGKLVWFILFGLVPFEAWRYAKAFLPAHTGLVTGTAFGLVIMLVGRGLFSLAVLPAAVGFVLGGIGIVLSIIHETLAYRLAEWFGLAVVDQADDYYVFRIAPIGGAFWALVYGALGALLDRRRKRQLGPNS